MPSSLDYCSLESLGCLLLKINCPISLEKSLTQGSQEVAMAGCVICESDKERIVARAENSQASFLFVFSAVNPLQQPTCSLLCRVYLSICLPSSVAVYNSINYIYIL
jgi:hypothetical protein